MCSPSAVRDLDSGNTSHALSIAFPWLSALAMVTSGSMLPLSAVTDFVHFLLFVAERKKLSMLDCCLGTIVFLNHQMPLLNSIKQHDKPFLTWCYYYIKGATNYFFCQCFGKSRWEGALHDETVFAIKINVFIKEKDHALWSEDNGCFYTRDG